MIKYYVEQECELVNFDFWGGAISTVHFLSEQDMAILEEHINSINKTITDNDINEFFWFETDSIAKILGYDDFDVLIKERIEACEKN